MYVKCLLFLTMLLALLLSACRKPEKFSEIPAIEFVSLEAYEDASTGTDVCLTFKFQDGDGDIGLDETDTQAPFDTSSIYYFNCFITYFEKQNGRFVKVETPSTLTCGFHD